MAVELRTCKVPTNQTIESIALISTMDCNSMQIVCNTVIILVFLEFLTLHKSTTGFINCTLLEQTVHFSGPFRRNLQGCVWEALHLRAINQQPQTAASVISRGQQGVQSSAANVDSYGYSVDWDANLRNAIRTITSPNQLP